MGCQPSADGSVLAVVPCRMDAKIISTAQLWGQRLCLSVTALATAHEAHWLHVQRCLPLPPQAGQQLAHHCSVGLLLA